MVSAVCRSHTRRSSFAENSAPRLHTHEVSSLTNLSTVYTIYLTIIPTPSNYLVWISALRNKHYLVTLSTGLTLLLATFSPLASSVFAVKNTEWLSSPVTVSNRQILSLNPALGSNANTSDRDLLSGAVVAAAGYAGAQAGFSGVPAPPFTFDGYTVGEFDVRRLHLVVVLNYLTLKRAPLDSARIWLEWHGLR